jgi:hypothetical protein
VRQRKNGACKNKDRDHERLPRSRDKDEHLNDEKRGAD